MLPNGIITPAGALLKNEVRAGTGQLYKIFVGWAQSAYPLAGGVAFHQSIGSGGVCPFDRG